VQDGPVLTLLRVLGQQQQGEDQLGVQCCIADDFQHCIHLEALAREEAVVHGHCAWSPWVKLECGLEGSPMDMTSRRMMCPSIS
jgi:hypothetical protein